ncbi:Spy0128 family protein, partial [Faecalitalea cylindroides]
DTVDFGQLTFSKVGDYVFTVTEDTKATVGGWTYDNDPKTITYHVTDEGFDGQLDATVDGNNPTVTNKYEAADFTGIPTDFTLTKVFEGKEWSTEDVFEFTLTAGNNTAGVDTPMPANTTVQVNAPTEEDGKTAKFDFGSISYDTVGEYHYTVSEVEGTNVGIDYSKNVAEITVTVTDNKQGGLVASAKVENGIFTNTYSSELDYVGKGGIELVKNLIGYDLTKDNQFTFTLSAADEASKEKAGMQDMSEDVFNTEDTMDANGLSTSTIQLLPKMQKFTQDDVGKVYKYTVSETSEQKPGYTNDTTEYTIQISTSDDGSGTLTVSTRITGTNGTDITYEYTQSKQKAETGVAQVVFNNTYTSSTNTEGYDASVNLTGTKTLTNRPMVDGEFQFNVLSNGSVVSSGTNTADGIVTFTPINYTNDQLIQDHANGIASKEGNTYTYVYDVEEVTPGNGVSIVAGKFSVTVKVTDNGDGKLVTKVIYPEGGLAFENAYGQSASAELKINGKKSLAENGTNHPDITDKFEFTITGSEGAPMPEKTTVRNDAAGNVDFGKIVYTMQNVFGDDGQQAIVEQETPVTEEQTTTEDGSVSEETEEVVGLTEQVETYSEKREKTFTYTITESGSLPGVTNDSAKVINVKVIDNGDGTISVTSDTQGTFTFVNTYVPDPTDETSPTDSAVTIKKVLDGRTLKADEFSFTMMDENGNGVQATNAEDGSVVFPKLTFDKEGIYTYTISETNDNKGGVNYDTTTYKAIATVTDDTSGKLKVEWKVTDAQGKEINEITFNNKYTVQPTSLTLGATKVLEGRELADKEFLFVLSDEEGNVVEEAYNDKTGKVTFSDLTFDKAGTYNYTVTEKNTNAKGITYDESVYNIQVEVVDNEDGTLNMTTTTTKDGEVSSIVFKNKAEKDSVPEQPEKGDTSNTSTRTFAGLFTSLAVDAAALAGIATLLKKRNAKK